MNSGFANLLRAAPIALTAFVVALALAACAVASGLAPDDAVTLWAGALTAGDGGMPIGRILAAYPTLPFLAATFLEVAVPAGTPTPALLAAGLLGVLAGACFLTLRTAQISAVLAGVLSLLLALHPALLRAAIAGPADMMLALFLFLFGRALYALRARSGVTEVMAAGLALLGIVFSHPMGAALALAVTPFLVFAVRPQLAAHSALNVVLTLIFPAVFCVAAFTYVSWVFPGSGWSFFTLPAESLAAWTAGTVSGPTGFRPLDAALIMTAALVAAAPFVSVAIAWVHRRRPLVAPVLVIAAAVIVATAMSVASGAFGDPAPLLVAGPVLAAIGIARIPEARERQAIVLALVAAGWFGGLLSLALADPRMAGHVRAAVEGRADPERTAALALGGATIGHDDILVDTINAPAVVLGRGRARGLIAPSDEPFVLATLFSRIDAAFVAVPNPQSISGAQDRLNRAFPLLYRSGAPGYRLIYQNEGWRLFARSSSTATTQ